jgi:hypothetical protein
MKTAGKKPCRAFTAAVFTAFVLVAAIAGTACGMDNIPAYYANWSNGIPSDPNYFPIAVWLQDPSTATGYKNAGVTLFIGLWQGPATGDLTTLAAKGMPVLCDQNAVGLANLTNKTIMGWTQMDEPDNAQPDGSGGYLPCIDPSVIVGNYNTWKANDPTRPVFLNVGQGASNTGYYGRGTCTGQTAMYAQYSQGADIISFDIYPVNDNYPLYYVPQGIDNLRNWTGDTKPVWCWIETTLISSDSTAKPTTAQVRSEVWMALIHGAAGFGYFCHSFYPTEDDQALLDDPVMLAAVTAINQQISSLAPVLNSNTIQGLVVAGTSNVAVPVDVMVKQYNGSTYIFAAAMRNGSTTGTFVVPLPDSSVNVLGESRQVQLSGGSFSDDFLPYDVHLYKIDSTGPTPTLTATINTSDTPVNTPAITVTNTSVTPAITATNTSVTPAMTGTPTYSPTTCGTCGPAPADTPVALTISNPMIYPNPYNAAGQAFVRFSISRPAGDVTLKLYTMAFRLIKTSNMGTCFVPGVVTEPLDENIFKGLSDGMYYYIITGKGGQPAQARSGVGEVIIIK